MLKEIQNKYGKIHNSYVFDYSGENEDMEGSS